MTLKLPNHSSVCAVEKKRDESEEAFPKDLEESIKESRISFVTKGWAPQQFILDQSCHCGDGDSQWLELHNRRHSSPMNMVNWPLSARQYRSKRLLTEVLRKGG
ncbi:hypothetical protein TIFTF001_004774 [Ficus carica]|uniref:Uncharacterized protein n=1 Tax=Ficus carica TaxID=3494 RepID=A0AA87ZE33_FICCA|nr:hypothetical protein TIFTF001_004774 [Ficus carica]